MELALDLALQATPDHPWVAEHPDWFTQLPDGSIAFAENLDPQEIIADDQDQARAIVFKGPDGRVELPARTVLVAAGTVPNITYEKELPNTFALDAKKRFFQGYRAERTADGITLTQDARGFFTSYNDEGRLISYYGDNHPAYAGNVVKAMASAKHGYRYVTALFPPHEIHQFTELFWGRIQSWRAMQQEKS